MRTITRKSLTGKEIIFYIPENDEDIEKLKEMEEKGLFDARESFSDDPEAFGENKIDPEQE